MTWLRIYHGVAVCCLCSAMALDLVPLARAQTKPPAVLDNPVAALSLDRLSATRERPLFSRSRHAPRSPVVSIMRPSAVQPPTPPPKIELHGTIINADETVAIVFSSGDNQTMRLHVGDEIGGWKVAVIDERKLVLSLAERTAEFTIFGDKNTNDAPASDQEQPRDQKVPSQPGARASLAPAVIGQR